MATAFFAPIHTAHTTAKPAVSRGFWRRVYDRLIAARAAEANHQMARYRHLATFRKDDATLADAFNRPN